MDSQQFQSLYDYNGFANNGGAILKANNGFFTTHLAIDPALSYTTLVAFFDEQGGLLWETSLSSATETLGQSNWNVNILDTQNGETCWVLGNYILEQENNLIPFLQKFSYNGQQLELIVLDTLENQRPDVWGGFLNESGLYLLCRDGTLGGSNELLIVKCSIEGQYLWHQSYDTGLTFNPKCIVDVGDGFIVGGSRYATLTDQGNGDGEQYIRKFNYAGVSQWTSTLAYGDNLNLGAISILKLENGNYLFAGTRNIDDFSIQPLIGELDAINGDTLWTKTYFDSEVYNPDELENYNSYNRIHGFKKLESGGYIGVGECRHEIIESAAFGTLDNAAFMMKLDDEFNLLWKRIYIPDDYAELDKSPAQCQLNDFVENEDGSITALGRVYMYTGTGSQGGYIQDTYFIQVDSLGCLYSGCEVGITEIELSSEMLAYPNPAMDHVNLHLPFIDEWILELFDYQGKLVIKEKLAPTNQVKLEVSNLNSGVYFLNCTNGRKTFSSKISVSH